MQTLDERTIRPNNRIAQSYFTSALGLFRTGELLIDTGIRIIARSVCELEPIIDAHTKMYCRSIDPAHDVKTLSGHGRNHGLSVSQGLVRDIVEQQDVLIHNGGFIQDAYLFEGRLVTPSKHGISSWNVCCRQTEMPEPFLMEAFGFRQMRIVPDIYQARREEPTNIPAIAIHSVGIGVHLTPYAAHTLFQMQNDR